MSVYAPATRTVLDDRYGVARRRAARGGDRALRGGALAIDPDTRRRWPTSPMSWAELGTALNRQGRGAEAVTHFARAIAIKPGEVSFYVNYGIALRQAGRLTTASPRSTARWR